MVGLDVFVGVTKIRARDYGSNHGHSSFYIA
jgi:hypothetical protein